LGNVSRQRLDEIWKGEKIRHLRNSLADYQFGSGCEVCEWQIAGGNYLGNLPSLFEEFPAESTEPEWPAMIEFAGSNTCNFECIMCWGELSSSIRKRRDGLPPLPQVYSDQFFQDLRRFLPHLRKAKFLGGEPFLANECFRIWDMMIEDGLNIPCHVATNGSQYNAKVERVLEAIPFSIIVSVDGATKETIETIRVNSHYETILENLHRFQAYAKQRGTYFGLTYCLMRQNWHEFGDFLLFAEDLGCQVFVNTVISPPHCSLYNLPPEDIARIAEKMETDGNSLPNRLRLNKQVWEETVGKLHRHANESQADRLTKTLETFEYAREEEDNVTAAKKLIDKCQYTEALNEVLKTPQKHSSYYYSLALGGYIRHLLGDLEGADRDLERAITMSRRRPEAFINRARLRLDQNRLEESLSDLVHARDLMQAGDYLEVHVCEVLSKLHIRLGTLSEAMSALDRWQDLQPRNPMVRVRRGEAFLHVGLAEKALVEIEAALALDPTCAEAATFKERIKALSEGGIPGGVNG
jgi:sulfatase maturation enzyme AslB (radical SAM superfamily)/Flp pilus assembly protein TadD